MELLRNTNLAGLSRNRRLGLRLGKGKQIVKAYLRANSDLKSSEYATPVLGLIFLKFADNKYRQYESEILEEYQKLKGGRREQQISDIALKKCGF